MLCMLLPLFAAAENNDTKTTENDSIPSIVERILDKKFKSRLNVDFCSSINGYFTENEFDELQ